MAKELVEVLEDVLRELREIKRSLRQDRLTKTVYSVAEAAKILGRSPGTVRGLIKAGRLRTSKPEGANKQVRHSVAKADLEALLPIQS